MQTTCRDIQAWGRLLDFLKEGFRGKGEPRVVIYLAQKPVRLASAPVLGTGLTEQTIELVGTVRRGIG
jgi:hypothetical protein